MDSWRDINNFDNYQINNLGIIKTKERIVIDSNGFSKKLKEKILKSYISTNGYPYILLKKNNKYFNKSIHRLLMETFNPIDNKLEVNHKDGNKLNYSLDNLEWCTREENMKHSYTVLKRKGVNVGRFGSKNKISKKINQYSINNELIKMWNSSYDIEKELNFRTSDIRDVCRGKQKTAFGFIWKYNN